MSIYCSLRTETLFIAVSSVSRRVSGTIRGVGRGVYLRNLTLGSLATGQTLQRESNLQANSRKYCSFPKAISLHWNLRLQGVEGMGSSSTGKRKRQNCNSLPWPVHPASSAPSCQHYLPDWNLPSVSPGGSSQFLLFSLGSVSFPVPRRELAVWASLLIAAVTKYQKLAGLKEDKFIILTMLQVRNSK